MTKKLPDVFSTHTAAQFCRVTPMTIIRWIKEGRIRAYKTPGGHRRIMRPDLEDFCRRAEIPVEAQAEVDTERNRRVLIIANERNVLEGIFDALVDDEGGDDASFEVEKANNSFDAGRLLVSFRPDIIFLDLDLPGVDPLRVARGIRTDPAIPSARLIGIKPQRGEVISEEFDAYLSRPLLRQDIRQITGPLPKLDLP
ncbi:excisionase family DNA-binding protein [Myxococcota bacterium]|nr:excisionase family DNA-binding protein [Myxococcota bacterium]MBU1431682.1 excisionase family DNA-binding protein [Myxococcota bacterium]MBU1899741.1 excisionase family DNA-binding protein [Myxococcota bacterium]